jgi:hypothetical protein
MSCLTDSEEDLPPPPDMLPPGAPKRILPKAADAGPRSALAVDSLSLGLNQRAAPRILPGPRVPSMALTQGFQPGDSKRLSTSSMKSVQDSVNRGSVATEEASVGTAFQKNLREGFVEVQGKFEGDEFERLFLKATKSSLLIRLDTGEDISFNLLDKCFVFEDTEDPTVFVLDDSKTNIIFKVTKRDWRIERSCDGHI